MNPSALFIARPVATTLLTVAIALAGALGFRLLPVSALPQVDFPTLSVSASLPGASPETMAATVATPLERALGHIAGVSEMSSQSSLGSSRITLQFDLDRDIDGAARDVQAAINAARSLLPSGLPSNPTYRKVNPADAPVMILALTSKSLDRGQMYDAAATVLAQKLAQLRGVGDVTVGGSSLPAVRVELNPRALNALGLGPETVRSALAAANVDRPKGAVEDDARRWQLGANDQLQRAADYLPLVVAYHDGAAVRLADVGAVNDSVQDLRNDGRNDGDPAVLLLVRRQPGANVIEVVDRIRALLPQLQASIPAAIDLKVVLDSTPTIRASVRDVERALALAAALVVGVVFVFLRSWRAALIPAVVVPVSLIGSFAAMYLAGFSLDNLSLMALTVATGFVVDDAVVVLENTSRHLETGLAPPRAARRGAAEVGFTVMAMSLSLVAVFIPILMLGGVVGRLFREFALTMTVAIGVSLLLSLTTTPSMCAHLLRPATPARPGRAQRLTRALERGFLALQAAYQRGLDRALRHRVAMLALTAATIACSVWLYIVVPKGFLPQQDTGRLVGNIQADQSISFQAMRGKLLDFMAIVRADPAVAGVTGFTGGGQRNSASLFVLLKPRSERGESADAVIARLRGQLAHEPGARLFLQSAQDIRVGGRAGNAQYQYTLQSDELQALRASEPRVRRALSQLPELADVSTDQQDKGLQTRLAVDRDSAARLGVSMQALDATLSDLFGQRQVSTIYNPLNQYHVVMEAAPAFWQDPARLAEVYVSAVRADGTAEMVPLAQFAHWEESNTPLAVNHQGEAVATTVSFNLAPGVSLSQAQRAIEAAMRRLALPAGVHGSFQGTARAFEQASANQALWILAAIAAVYIVLGMLYESWLHPLTILSTLPSAGVGALLALWATGTEFSVVALIGVLLLVGIVKKNAIMLVDFALAAERREGLGPLEAVRRAAALRLRPILMTSAAALLGALPLALGHGDGAELRRPLGIAIVGGLLVSQLLTLFTTPVVHLSLAQWQARRARRRAATSAPGTPAPGAATP